MTIKREYSILPQAERDDFHHHVKEGQNRVTNQYFCVISVVTLVIFLILAGVATLTATMFYSNEITTTFGQLWYKSESASTTTTSGDSSWPSGSGSRNDTKHEGSQSTTPLVAHVYKHNSSDHTRRNKTNEPNLHYHHHHHHLTNINESSHENYTFVESHSRNGTNNHTSGETDDDSGDMDDEENPLNLDDVKDKLAATIRNIEKRMESITGIRRAEFLVPIFMLICFLSFFSLISLCCCVMMRRRENRRRKLFGKLITDLQTGDSKTVLLNHSDLDD